MRTYSLLYCEGIWMWQIGYGGMLFWQARCEYVLASECETLSVEVIFVTFVSGLHKDGLGYCMRSLTTTSHLEVQRREEKRPLLR